MIAVAAAVFTYYTLWVIVMVCEIASFSSLTALYTVKAMVYWLELYSVV